MPSPNGAHTWLALGFSCKPPGLGVKAPALDIFEAFSTSVWIDYLSSRQTKLQTLYLNTMKFFVTPMHRLQSLLVKPWVISKYSLLPLLLCRSASCSYVRLVIVSALWEIRFNYVEFVVAPLREVAWASCLCYGTFGCLGYRIVIVFVTWDLDCLYYVGSWLLLIRGIWIVSAT